MATTLQFRRGDTAAAANVTGADGEIYINTQTKTVHVHDGSTAGGFALANASSVADAVSSAANASNLSTGTVAAARLGTGTADATTYLRGDGSWQPTFINVIETGSNVAIGNTVTGCSFITVDGTGFTVNTAYGLSVVNDLNVGGAVYASRGATLYSNTYIDYNSGMGALYINGKLFANNSMGTAGQVLKTNGTGYTYWGDASGGSGTDLESVSTDILPALDSVFDIGSSNKQWYDLYLSSGLKINGAELTATDGVFSTGDDVVLTGALLADELLITANMITPDSNTAIQYFGEQGVVVVDGNLDIQGDWVSTPVVETIPEVIGTTAGHLDTSFNTTGHFNNAIESVSVQSDGKVIVGGQFAQYNGTTTNRIIRLTASGERDASWTGAGFNSAVLSVASQSNGGTLVAGTFTLYNNNIATLGRFARLLPDGTLDTNFLSFSNGGFNGNTHCIAVQSDGKILVGGSFTTYGGYTANRIARLNADGSPDTLFLGNITGFGNGTVRSIKVQPNGQIIVGGDFTTYNTASAAGVIRINADGSRDSSFSVGTGFNNGSVYDVAFQSDGKIIVVGSFLTFGMTSVQRIVRLNVNGTLDLEFFSSAGFGVGFNGDAYGVTVQADGKILATGAFTQYGGVAAGRIVRLTSTGKIDPTFVTGAGFDGTVVSKPTINTLNGNILIGGIFTAYNGILTGNLISLYENTTEGHPAVLPPSSGEAGFLRYNNDISAFQGYNGTSWELLERVTTPPTSLATTGTIDIDFSGALLHTQGALTGAITYTGSNYAAGSSVTIRVVGGASSQAVTFPAGWVFVGTTPTTLNAGLTAILTVTSFGTTEADCVAAWAVST